MRVAPEKQTDGDKYGLPAQRTDISSYALDRGIEIIAWYTDNGQSSDGTLGRPGLQRLLADAGAKLFGTVLVAKMDRLAHDLFAALFIEKELLINGVEIVSVNEPANDENPANADFRRMISVFAEMEKSMLTRRMTGARKVKARHGGYAGGGAPLGYRANRGGKVLELDLEKAATVKRVFFLRRERPQWSLQDIADQLNREGHTTAQGKPFRRMQVKRVLDREALYSGRYVYAGITAKGRHESII